MKYLSVCSGIEAASVAWEALEWNPIGFSETDPFATAVLSQRFPDVRNYGDMRQFDGWKFASAIDVLVGGTPCQSFSVAGIRAGLSDERGNLALVYCKILERFRPRWFIWENVPGVLSSNGGRDFGSILGAVAQLGYGVAYRVLDAQFFGVPQRRRRVFLVGYSGGDWRPPTAVLFEPESLRWDIAKGRGEKQKVARTLRGRSNSSHREDSDNFVVGTLNANGKAAGSATQQDAECGLLLPVVSHACLAKGGSGRLNPSCETFIACTLPASDGGVSNGMHPVIAFDCKAAGKTGFSIGDVAGALRGNGHGGGHSAIAYQCHGSNVGPMGTLRSGHGDVSSGVPFIPLTISGRARGDDGRGYDRPEHISEVAGTVDATKPDRVLDSSMAVRRLTPREYERLQGFPDDWTLIQYRKKPAADGPRYKAIGNSMAVPVMRWIGLRLELVDRQLKGIES